ncbi:MAG: hypothetical protein MRZ79_13960 [Bacteroidia bacterium]|nr:hypothetical protein [Bacteroidia bacterium]
MISTRTLGLARTIRWSGKDFLMLAIFSGIIAALYHFKIINFVLPWLPVSVIATAVAFYVGFKNNQSYDRLWEARKIWGGIVNDSRSWGMMVDGFISNFFTSQEVPEQEILQIKKRLIYRHIAWMYAHRGQLLIPTEWEHISSQNGKVARAAERYQNNHGIGTINSEEQSRIDLQNFLPQGEYERMINYKNTATQIINEQNRDLSELRAWGLIDDFRHMELANLLKSFYTLQGKNERIKKYPLPRQYANMSRYFVRIFIILLPFSMIPTLMETSEWGLWFSVPITALVAWVYWVMEAVGDFSENPFQGMANDIPMLSLCRVIEIDLREMLGEKELPPAVKSKNGVLM